VTLVARLRKYCGVSREMFENVTSVARRRELCGVSRDIFKTRHQKRVGESRGFGAIFLVVELPPKEIF